MHVKKNDIVCLNNNLSKMPQNIRIFPIFQLGIITTILINISVFKKFKTCIQNSI